MSNKIFNVLYKEFHPKLDIKEIVYITNQLLEIDKSYRNIIFHSFKDSYYFSLSANNSIKYTKYTDNTEITLFI